VIDVEGLGKGWASLLVEEATVEVRATDPVDVQIGQLPPPGTAVIPVTEEASTDLSQEAFTMIVYEERGGINDTALLIEINADGTGTRNGEAIQISEAELARLNDALIEAHFFSISGVFEQPGTGPEVTSYTVTVILENGSEARIDAQDGFTPPELQRLFSVLRQVGETA